MTTLIHERVEAARAGTNPTVICRMPSGEINFAKIVLRHRPTSEKCGSTLAR